LLQDAPFSRRGAVTLLLLTSWLWFRIERPFAFRVCGLTCSSKKKQVAFVYKALVAPFLTEQTRAKIKFEPAHATSRALAVDSPAAMGEGFGEESCTGSASSSDFDPAAYLARDL
jgi:hypothetical protein